MDSWPNLLTLTFASIEKREKNRAPNGAQKKFSTVNPDHQRIALLENMEE